MRIALVSSRYPPDAWGGAPIVVQRLAHGFLDRGHDVRIFAGAVNEQGREAGECWDGADERGMPIRWMDLSRWESQRDEWNFHNPLAEERFAEFLREHPTDLVHLHVPQGLGGGLVRVAAEAGARVVVTMHDWWWFCARQFLMDKSGRRCSPVVDAGTCECEVSRAWLAKRRTWIDEQLRHADLVLAPSETTAASYAANGIDPVKLGVDENGVPPVAVGTTHDHSGVVDKTSPAVRFLYVGGSSYVKGVDVVFRAAQSLARIPGWELDAYGAEAYVKKERVDLSRLPARVVPPYLPSEIGTVLNSADVLLVPTITSESHSIITREALQHGLPVITSNCWGPEEVVQHGHNGLIVPTGDPDALAAAMRTLVTDTSLLRQMQRNCGGVTIRTADEQIEGLLAQYEQVLGRSNSSDSESTSSAATPTVDAQEAISRRVAILSDNVLRIPRIPGPLRIGVYADTEKDWNIAAPALLDYLRQNGESELFSLGAASAPEQLRSRVAEIGEQEWHRLPALLRQMDVIAVPRAGETASVAPQEWLEAGLVATPVIASLQAPFSAAIEDGANGVLAAADEEWREGLSRLAADPAERRRLGERARRDVLFSQWLQKRENALLAAVAERTSAQAPTIRLYGKRMLEFPLPTNAVGPMQIDLMAATFGTAGGPLVVTLYDAENPDVRYQATAHSFQTGDRVWVSFHFDVAGEIADPWLRVERAGKMQGDPFATKGSGGALALWAERGGVHYVSGRAVGGGPCIRIWGEEKRVQQRTTGTARLSRLAKLGPRWRFAEYLVRTEGASALTRRVMGFFTQRG